MKKRRGIQRFKARINPVSKFLESTFQVRLFLIGSRESVKDLGKNLAKNLSEFEVDTDPIEVEDIHVMLLSKFQEQGLSEWKDVEEQFRKAIDESISKNTKVGVLGISYVYQAVFDRINDDTGTNAIKELRYPGIDIAAKPFSQNVPGGFMYLLHLTPMETLGQKNFLPVLRYLAICEQSHEEELNKNLSFVFRDITLYKAHHNLNRFRMKTAEEDFQENLRAIVKDVQSLFKEKEILGDKTKNALEKLSVSWQDLVGIYIYLTNLATSNSQQYINYRHSFDSEEASIAQGQVWHFLCERMRILHEEIEIEMSDCKAVLETAQQAFAMVQTRINQAEETLERKKENRRQRSEELIAYLGLAIALPELISYELVETLWEYWFKSLKPIYYFLIQLLLIVVFGLVLVKIIRDATDNFGKKAKVKEVNRSAE